MFEPILPPGPPASAVELLSAARLAELAGDERPYTYCNFVSTLDGRATLDGSAKPLGDESDLDMLIGLRIVSDAVLVGPRTVAAEGYRRLLRPGRRPGPPPIAVLISRSFDIPWDAHLFEAPEQPVIIYTYRDAPEAPRTGAEVEVVRLEQCTPAAALADLRSRGVRALLCEGGPSLFHSLLAAGLVDELFLTVSAMITGDETEARIVTGSRLPDPTRFELKWVLRAGDELFLRYASLR